jgi:hypothetical protein
MGPGVGQGVVKGKNIVSLSGYKPQVVQAVAYSLYRPSYLDYCIIITVIVTVAVVTIIIVAIVLLFHVHQQTVKNTFPPGMQYICQSLKSAFGL